MSTETTKFSLQVAMGEHEDEIDADIIAAISASVQTYMEMFDSGSDFVLTIRRVQRPYSPWSSKIYGLRQSPNHFYKR